MNDLDTLAYAQVEHEKECGYFAPGLRSKAFADADGDMQRAEAFYIRYRAEQIKQEYLHEMAMRKKEEEERRRQEIARQKAAQKEKDEKAKRNQAPTLENGSSQNDFSGLIKSLAIVLLMLWGAIWLLQFT